MVATSSLLLFYHHRPRHDHDDGGGYDVDDYHHDVGDKDHRNCFTNHYNGYGYSDYDDDDQLKRQHIPLLLLHQVRSLSTI